MASRKAVWQTWTWICGYGTCGSNQPARHMNSGWNSRKDLERRTYWESEDVETGAHSWLAWTGTWTWTRRGCHMLVGLGEARSKKQEASDLADEACSSGCPACANKVTLTLQRESEVLCSVWWFLGTGGKGTWPGVGRLETGDWRGTWVQTRHWNRL